MKFDLDWWEDIINYFLTQINSENAIIRATSCDCISNIPEKIFEQMNVIIIIIYYNLYIYNYKILY